ncbi:VOC family protein [Motilimonas sp. E26]|uniref:VOC family protein n=1 Tax=Motilimonas sp. E26 TaxID=2865674 RepID=UPI001E5FBD5E|nr:VOC family protein [Motilimonas sp. E26]MCE0556220.1 VOC family protein [Motilimonas sp. E26]
MSDWQLRFHHFGLAVHDPKAARIYLKGLGYQLGEALYDPLQKVNLQMAEHANQPRVELVWPAGESGPLDNILQGQQGIIYHTCYTAKDVEKSIVSMQQQGLRIVPVSAPKPAILFAGKYVSFYIVRGVGLIEVLHDD